MSGKVLFTIGAVLRGDDAAGPYLAKMVEDSPIDGWTVVDGGQMPEDEIAVVRRMAPDELVVVDAAEMGLAPGEVRVLHAEDVVSDYLVTTHSLPLTFVLGELEACCKSLTFLGVQPAQLGFFEPLTPAVLQGVETIAQALAHNDLSRFQAL